MSNFIRRLLYVGYWCLIAFTFAYSAYCYLQSKGAFSQRAAVGMAERRVSEVSKAPQGALPESASSETLALRPDDEPLFDSQPTEGTVDDWEEDRRAVESPEPAKPLIACAQKKDAAPPVPAPSDAMNVSLSPEGLASASDLTSSPEDFQQVAAVEDALSSPPSISIDRVVEKPAAVPRETELDDSLGRDEKQLPFASTEEAGKVELGLISISEIRIGDRTAGTNPEGGDGSDESVFEKEPHYIFTLRLADEDGSYCTARLLRSLSWMRSVPTRERRVSDGRLIDSNEVETEGAEASLESEEYVFEKWLDLESFGFVGWAEVLSIEDFQYRAGEGNLVTGTFERVAPEMLALSVEGQDKPINCTPNHPFWSADREEFVEACELMIDERVTLFNGETKRIVQCLPRPGPEKVYNIEVFDEHVYHVTSDGILVHNYCVYAGTRQDGSVDFGYIGRTKNFNQRSSAHERIGRFTVAIPGLDNVSYEESRYIEDLLIRHLGLPNLDNKINGMTVKKSLELPKSLRENAEKKLLDALGLRGRYGNLKDVPPSQVDKILQEILNKAMGKS